MRQRETGSSGRAVSATAGTSARRWGRRGVSVEGKKNARTDGLGRFSRVGKRAVESQVRDPRVVTNIARDQFEVVVERSGGDLQIGVIETSPCRFERSAHAAENLRDRRVIGQNRHHRDYSLFYVVEVPITCSGPVRSVV